MKLKSVVLLAFAIGCGLVAMLGVQQALSGNTDQRNDQVQILVATADIQAGVRMDETNVAFQNWPAENVPEGAIVSIEQYEERAPLIPVFAGDVIMESKLGAKGAIGASLSIEKGMRVVSVPVTDTKTHSGMLLPGDRVDVLVTYQVRSRTAGMIKKTRTLLEFIQVFAADSRRSLESGEDQEIKAKTISLVVTPKQAEVLKLAESKGTLDLVMRNKLDDELVGNAGGVDELLMEELAVGSTLSESTDDEEDEERPRRVAQEEAPDKNDLDLQSFLSQSGETNISEPVVTEPNVWKIKIYQGEEVIEHELELPAEPVEEPRWREFGLNDVEFPAETTTEQKLPEPTTFGIGNASAQATPAGNGSSVETTGSWDELLNTIQKLDVLGGTKTKAPKKPEVPTDQEIGAGIKEVDKILNGGDTIQPLSDS